MISRFCRHCDHEYRILDLDDGGLCGSCESEALSKFKLPSWRDAFGIVLLIGVVFGILIILGCSQGWS